MTEEYINQILKTSVAAICQKIGWDASQTSVIDILADLWKRQLLQIGKTCHRNAEHNGRAEVNHDDMGLAFRDMNISAPELAEYVQNFDPVRLPYRTHSFPVSKQSHLNFLRPGSSEVLTRPVHIHEYMPPWAASEEKIEKINGEMSGFHDMDIRNNSMPSPVPAAASFSTETTKLVKENIVKIEAVEPIHRPVGESPEDNLNEAEGSGQQPSSTLTLPLKRINGSGENPALKRVRILMEEEGHPLREISSVMMTTSGFLSSSREGRLPEPRPPPNRDFFEPEPVVEKKKKIVTMKKIVEGVKKIDKEKENQDELFGKPDTLLTPEIKIKTEVLKKSKERFSTKELNDKKLKHIDKDSKADKLKIFKKKTKEVEKQRKEIKEKPQVKVEIKMETNLEQVSSNESFHDFFLGKQEGDVSEEKRKKKHKELRTDPVQTRKEKKRERLLVPGVVPIPRTSPNVFPNIHKLKRQTAPQVPEVIRKKQKKSKLSLMQLSLGGLKSPKHSKKMRHMSGLKSLIPEISINISRPLPPPPELKPYLGTMSLAPGLIPTNFGPPPPLRLGGSNLSPSITITPATSSHHHPSKDSTKKSSPSLPLPSNVCSSVTITRIDMPSSQKLPSQYDTTLTPGIGIQMNSTGKQSPLPIQSESSSGITITPILMTGDHKVKSERLEKPIGSGGLAKLEEDLRSKEQRRKEKEKRKELKKEKKKEKKEKEKDRLIREKDEKHPQDNKKERKEKEKVKEKKKDSLVEQTIPKLTLKLHSNTSTPVDSPSRVSERTETPPPPPRKITIKPIEDVIKRRTPSPELARFSPLVTRPAKPHKVTSPKPSPPIALPVTPDKSSSEKRSSGKSKSRSSTSKASSSSSQSGLVTETVGFYIDEHGNKVWICPAVGCGREDDGSPMIGCDICDDWYHFACVGIEETPDDNEHWYCPRCVKKGARKGRSISLGKSE